MAKKIILIIIWSVAFYFGSAMLIGFLSGLFCAAMTLYNAHLNEHMTSAIGISWIIVPMIFGPIGLLLGIFGKLPGTRK